MIKIGVAGIGGIGSNVAMHLTRSGIKQLKIADFDKVEESNLTRQFYFKNQIGMFKVDALEENLTNINPEIVIEKVNSVLDKDNIEKTFHDCGIIIEGFDKAVLKAMLLETFYESPAVIVSASGVAGLDTSAIRVKKPNGHIYIAGDFVSDFHENKLYSSKVGTVAAIMASIVLKELGFN